MFEGIGDAVDVWVKTTAVLLVVFIPLGLWKAVEIVMWIARNVRIEVTP
jgi:hypothetical protein